MLELNEDQIARFREDGFVIVERIIDAEAAALVARRFEGLFRGEFETGLYPDEWNWREGRDSPDLTRQICNGWKADLAVARIVLSPEIGRACARLMGWTGARLNQDNVIWKPPGAKPLGFHQDASYEQWVVPPEMVTCWIALDDTSADGGPVAYARGSHQWGLFPPIGQFHAPEDPTEDLRAAAATVGEKPTITPVVVPAGGGAFHSGLTWHGSESNRSSRPRRSLIAHCMASDARFHPTNVSYIYSRYKRFGDTELDESFFPILWTQNGGRSAFLADYLTDGRKGPG